MPLPWRASRSRSGSPARPSRTNCFALPVGQYREAIDAFFAGLPEVQWIRTLPIGDHGVTAPTLWALLGTPLSGGSRGSTSKGMRAPCP